MIITIIKNFQAKFKEDQEACTFDGSVDWHGRPAIRAKSGRWVAGIIILCKQLLTHDDFLKKILFKRSGKEFNLINKISLFIFVFRVGYTVFPLIYPTFSMIPS
jgi:ABC-type uncharacterized transport system permease subunit